VVNRDARQIECVPARNRAVMRPKLQSEPRRDLTRHISRRVLDENAANGEGVARGDDAFLDRESARSGRSFLEPV
jgi:hypothetical protein